MFFEIWASSPFFICVAEMDIAGIVEQVVSGLGYELVDLDLSPRGRLMRIFIDIERGINVDDCATVSHQLQRVFEVEGVEYDRLEVSSPGLDRPLTKLADFERFAGQQVQVRLRSAVGNQRTFVGRLDGLRDGQVLLVSDKGEHLFCMDQIDKARLVPQF